MGLIGDVTLLKKMGLPEKGSTAYKLAGLAEVEGKINSIVLQPQSNGNGYIALDKNKNVLFVYRYDAKTKETFVSRPFTGGDICTMIDKDSDGNYDMISLCIKSTNTIFDFRSTKDDGYYDEKYYNTNKEDDNGLLIYRKF